MAAVARKNHSNWPLAAFVLLIGASRHYGWLLAEPALRGIVSKALGGAATLCLLWLLWVRVRPTTLTPLVLVFVWYAFEELQVVVCSVSFAIAPWVVPVGHSICSARFGFDMGAVGIFVVGLIALGLQNGD